MTLNVTTNSIEGCCVYDWLMEKRNDINYRDCTFMEPANGNFYIDLFDKSKIERRINNYIEDSTPIYCFDKDHCMLAAPIRRFIDVKRSFKQNNISNPLTNGRKQSIEKLLNPIITSTNSKMKIFTEY